MVLTTMKCQLPNVHELFLYIGFSFSGCYLSQQLSQNNILLTTIKFKTSRLLCKIQGFQGLEFGPITFKVSQVFQGPVWTLHSAAIKRACVPCDGGRRRVVPAPPPSAAAGS